MSRLSGRRRGFPWLVAGLMLVAGPCRSAGQSAATVPILDPVYGDLARLESLGLIPSGWTGHRPWSVARVRSLAVRAEETLRTRLGPDDPGRREAAELLERVRKRFGDDHVPFRALVEAELGGGSSPGRGIPANGEGKAVDAVVDPLWAGRVGRAYGDRATLGLGGSVAVAIGRQWAVAVGARGSTVSATGRVPVRRDLQVETAYLRGILGAWAVQVGRDAVAWSWKGGRGLLLSENGPPLDLIRISTERPLGLGPLGDLETSVLAADLGPRQNFPHAKLFGARTELTPVSALSIGLSVLNKQMGEGAPDASTGARIRDITVLWGLFQGDDIDRFSDKLAGLDVRARLPGGASLLGNVIVTDFDKDRVGDIMDVAAGYQIELELAPIGEERSHELGFAFQRTGPLVYRHHQFQTGLAVDGFLQASSAGPDSRSMSLRYGHRSTTTLDAELAAESNSVDPHSVVLTPNRNVYRSGDLPNETRLRGRLRASRPLWDDTGGVVLSAGIERVWAFDFVEDASRTNAAVSFRLWRDVGLKR